MTKFFKTHSAFLVFCATILVSAVILVSIFTGLNMPPAAPLSESWAGYNGGEPVAAVRIGDFDGLASLTYANYTAGEYVLPVSKTLPKGELVELSSHVPAPGKGTYQFVISHVDADAEGAKAIFRDAREKYLGLDGDLHLTVYIPTVFASCVVYLDNTIVDTAGSLSDYNFIDYNENYTGKMEKHDSGTKGVFLDVKLYGRRVEGIGHGLEEGHTVTIHFESDGNLLSGIRGTPYIGTEKEVFGFVQTNLNLSTAGAVVAGIALGIFIFLCLLKKTLSFLPQLGVMTGVFLTCLSRILLWGSTSYPYLLSAAGMLGIAFILFAPTIIMRIRIGRFPVWMLLAAIAGVNVAVHIVMPIVPPASFAALHIYRIVITLFLSAAVLASTGYMAYKGQKGVLDVALPVLAAVVSAIIPFLPLWTLTAYTMPVIYLFYLILIVTIAVFFKEFVTAERTSAYLTKNLRSEVARRTENLTSVIAERDKILRYISHDMRKPVVSVKRYVAELGSTESDPVRQKAFKTVQQKIETVDKNLVELQKYAKLNFSAEKAQRIDLGEVLQSVFDALSPDCEANNVRLHLHTAENEAFSRRNTLAAVLNNLIFNALEHSGCENIWLSSTRTRKACRINVADDGKGLDKNSAPFAPYETGNPQGENLGLGLYICRDLVHDMGGELSYARTDGKTIFTISLPPA